MKPQGRGRFQTHRLSDLVDRLGGGLEAVLRGEQTLMGKPLMRRRPGLPAETSRERPLRHHGAPGQRLHLEAVAQPPLGPVEDRSQASALRRPHRSGYVLRLTTIAVWRDDETPSYAVGDLGAVILPDDVQAQIDARGAARRSQDPALIDIQGLRLHPDSGIRGAQSVDMHPVGRRSPAVQESGRGEDEDA